MASADKSLKILEKTGFGLILTVFMATTNLLSAFFVMLGAGVAHSYWPVIPAFGYWATYLMLLGLGSVAGAIHGGLRVKWTDK